MEDEDEDAEKDDDGCGGQDRDDDAPLLHDAAPLEPVAAQQCVEVGGAGGALPPTPQLQKKKSHSWKPQQHLSISTN